MNIIVWLTTALYFSFVTADLHGTFKNGSRFRVKDLNFAEIQSETQRSFPVNDGSRREPKFEFYLYNDAGNMVKQYLTVREIQQILLQQSLQLGRNLKFHFYLLPTIFYW